MRNDSVLAASETITLGACFLWLALYFVARPNTAAVCGVIRAGGRST